LHAYELGRRHLQEVLALVAGRRFEARAALPGMNPRRADSVVGGSVVLECLMDAVGAGQLLVAGQGLREGLVLEAYGHRIPPPAAVRASSIAALARRFAGWESARAARRSALALSLYRKLEPHAPPLFEELLAHAASALDSGRSMDYYRRHEHTAMILRSTGLQGFLHREILLLAAVVEMADDERWSLKPYRPLLHEDDLAVLERAAVVLALADRVEQRLPPGRAPLVACTVTRQTVRLGEPFLAAWEDTEFAERFGRAFGKRLEMDGPRP
jgi:exopolyphosphatase/guanosine-5'-triphosphate,3'-diphosphate pyrophosphatase